MQPAETNDIGSTISPGNRMIARNALINLMGHGVPLLVALVAIPVFIRGLGIERFGVLSLVWMFVGYFTLFDLGIGRATTKMVAEHIARKETDILAHLVWTSLWMLFCLGLSGAFLLALLNPFIVSIFFKIPSDLWQETSTTLYLVAASIPVILGTAAIRGILEAQQKFGLINAIKIPSSVLFLATPLLVMMFSNHLYSITAAMIGVRIIELIAYSFFCIRSFPCLKHPQWMKVEHVKELFGFGGWLTLSNIVGPLMTYMDRFIIGSLVSMSAVVYYTTPYDFVARLAVIPGSLLGVVFPALSASFVTDNNRFISLYDKTVLYVLCIMTPVVLIVAILAQPFLNIWLGKEFAAQSTRVFQILSVGTLLNSVGQVPYSAILAMGRPDISAKIHMLELPLYLSMVCFFTIKMGITGTALAWLIRVAADTLFLFLAARRIMPENVTLAKSEVQIRYV